MKTINLNTVKGILSFFVIFIISATNLSAQYSGGQADGYASSGASFGFPAAPTATTNAATSITGIAATLNGTVNANNASTTVTFEYGLTTSYGTTVTANQSQVTGATNTSVSNSISSLTPNKSYHYRVVGVNSEGTTNGADMTFTTSPEAATITTQAVSDFAGTTATGNGNITSLGNPNPTQHGVCWNITGSPISTDAHTEEGTASATGAFTSNITALSNCQTYYVRAYATNSAGTSYGIEVSFTTTDETGPVPDVATLSDLTAECSVATPTAPTATDNCAGSVTGTTTTTFPITSTTVVTWSYDDGNGNTATQTQNVIIDDNTGPVPDVATLSDLTAECSVATPTAPTATDNCAGSVTGTTTTTFPITTQGTTVVTWTYDDGNGNTATQNQNVILTDVTNPTITCIGNQTINLTAGQSTYTVSGTEFDPTATDDNCGIASVKNSFNNSSTTLSGASLPAGTTNIVWTVTDNAGNTATCSFDVVVNANTTAIETLKQNGISIYPNPTNGILNFEFTTGGIQKISILNLSGKTIIEKTSNILPKETFNLQQFKAGIYIIVIQTNKEVIKTKIMKN